MEGLSKCSFHHKSRPRNGLSSDRRCGKIRLVERKKLQDSYITVLFIVNDMQNLTKKIYAKVWLEFNDPTALTCQMPENFLMTNKALQIIIHR